MKIAGKILGFLLIGINLYGADKNSLGNERFEIQRFGISFIKPNSWIEADRELLEKNLNKLDDQEEDIEKLLRDYRGSMLVSGLYKYDRNKYPDVIPTIQVHARLNPAGNSPKFLEFIKYSAGRLSETYNEYEITSEVEWVEISGIKMVFFESEFELHLANAESRKVKHITYAIPFEKTLLQVGMSEKYPLESSELFKKFMLSFRSIGSREETSNKPAALPKDEEIRELIVGTWVRRSRSTNIAVYGESTYLKNGSGHGYAEISRADEAGQIKSTQRIENRFKWTVEDGILHIIPVERIPPPKSPEPAVTKEIILRINKVNFASRHIKGGPTITRKRKMMESDPLRSPELEF